MNIILLVPNVVRRYIASLPEVRNNAYGYFNYDHRVVNERVQRFDMPSTYKGPNDFNDGEYDSLVAFAQQFVNPGLARYSKVVACEDALNLAIKSFNKGMFDGKVNANKFQVLLAALLQNQVGLKQGALKKDVLVKERTLKELGIDKKDVPHLHQVQHKVKKGLPHIVKEKGQIKIKK